MTNSELRVETIKNDILYHLNNSITMIKSLQLDYNRDKRIISLCDSIISEIDISEKLLKTTDISLSYEISNEVNKLFKIDKGLSDVLVCITNSKRLKSSFPAILKLEI